MSLARLPWRIIAAQVAVLGLGAVGALVAGVLVTAATGPTLLPALLVAVLITAAALTTAIWLETRKAGHFAVEPPPAGDHRTNIQALTTSRRAIVDSFEIERARIERDLHDGAQQYLVAASMKVGEAALALDQVTAAHPDDDAAASAATLLDQAQDDAAAALKALRETVAGVHSRLLAEQGLEPALRELAARFGGSDRSVVLRIPHRLPELPPGVASAAWFLASEALTNAAKYAPGADVSLVVAAGPDLHVSIVDEGPGGAELRPGHGLAGMRDRLEAFGGTVTVSSPPGGPTSVSARIPLLLNIGDSGVQQ